MIVERLGKFVFKKGYYIYVGSARGPGGLKGRIKHHYNPCNKPHWHIDYLRKITELEEIWVQRSQINREHMWASCLHAKQGGRSLIRGFGSSDCLCATHLFYFSNMPEKSRFQDLTDSKVETIQNYTLMKA